MTNKELRAQALGALIAPAKLLKALVPGIRVTVIVGVEADGVIEYGIVSQEPTGNTPAVLKRMAMICEEKGDERSRIIRPGVVQ